MKIGQNNLHGHVHIPEVKKLYMIREVETSQVSMRKKQQARRWIFPEYEKV